MTGMSPLSPELVSMLNEYIRKQRKVKIQCLLSEQQFHELIQQSHNINYNISQNKLIKYDQHTYTSFTVSNANTNEEIGRFQSLQAGDELYILSRSTSQFFNHVVLPMLKRMYPNVLFAFIRSKEIYKILVDFEQKKNTKLKFKSVIRKKIFGERPRTELNWETSKEGRQYFSFRDLFTKSNEENLWIDNIKVFTAEQERHYIQFSITRRGLVSLDHGWLGELFSDIIQPIVTYSKNQKKQFEHRSRNEQPDKNPKPLIIKFKKDVFKQLTVRKEFARILNRYNHCSYSIIHDGNPHVYLSILDRKDNSTFTVRTYSTDSLLLIPQIKTTPSSLMRFSEFLLSSFYEGDIENFEQKTKPATN